MKRKRKKSAADSPSKTAASGSATAARNVNVPVTEEPEYSRRLREGRFVDPLSEVTRRERKNLLLVSFISLAVTLGNLVPQEISALGIKVSTTEQRNLYLLLACAVLYLMAAFIFYGHAEFQRWQADLASVQRLRRKSAGEIQKQLLKDRETRVAPASEAQFDSAQLDSLVVAAQASDDLKQSDRFIRSARRRLWFEYSVPLLAGVWALGLLFEGSTGIEILEGPSSLVVAYPVASLIVLIVLAVGLGSRIWKAEIAAGKRRFRRWQDSRHHKRFMKLSERLKGLPEGSDERKQLTERLQEDFHKRLDLMMKRTGVDPEKRRELRERRRAAAEPKAEMDG